MQEGKYLAVVNWKKFQPQLKNGKRERGWIRVNTRLEEDEDFLALSFFQRSVLQAIWRIRGRTGRNVPFDYSYLRRALALSPAESKHLPEAIAALTKPKASGASLGPEKGVSGGAAVDQRWISAGSAVDQLGFLVFSNQQIDPEFPPQDNTLQDKIEKPKKQVSLARDQQPALIAEPPAWQGQVLIVEARVDKAMREGFPKLPTLGLYRAADRWLVTNPARRKKNFGRFLLNWFQREQEKIDRRLLTNEKQTAGQKRNSTNQDILNRFLAENAGGTLPA